MYKKKLFHNGTSSLIYREFLPDYNNIVLIKTFKPVIPASKQNEFIDNEYYNTYDLDIPGIRKALKKESVNGQSSIFLYYIDGITLKEFLSSETTVQEKINIAVQLSDSLGRLHEKNIIHKNICSHNIIIDPKNKKTTIIDFSLSTKKNTFTSPEPEGQLEYISPEQTGRISRPADYRTDLYSLGVTLYELFTRNLPFSGNDPLSLIHQHIAKEPQSPKKFNREIPEILSRIILKLINKNPDERYQSAYGLKNDLIRCLECSSKDELLTLDFPLARNDFAGKFLIPRKLYGREEELKYISDKFEKIQDGESTLLLVEGTSGIGKSSLVHEIQKKILNNNGYFIEGKFDQLNKNIPYSAVKNAFSSLVRYLLTESEDGLSKWREKITSVMGLNCQQIIDIVPELELVTGKQPEVKKLDGIESVKRFNIVIQNFISIFCRKEHPLVIFLDDLQWADTATLNLIELLITDPQTGYLFIIGAFRDEEISENHPLTTVKNNIIKAGLGVRSIKLGPLEKEPLLEFVSDAMKQIYESDSNMLVDFLYKKTGGNPFFISEFLRILYEEGLVRFNTDMYIWECDSEKILSFGFSDNILDLILVNMKKLPTETSRLLGLAACLGTRFTIDLLCTISESSLDNVLENLSYAIEEGMIIPIVLSDSAHNDEKSINTPSINPDKLSKRNWEHFNEFRFRHDRIQQAAYAPIEKGNYKEIHLKIGRLLFPRAEKEEDDEILFETVSHFNIAKSIITDKQEKKDLLILNMRAGQKAMGSTAYVSAADYIAIAIELLPSDSWISNYDLTIELYKEFTKANYLKGNFDKAIQLADYTLNKAVSAFDRAEVLKIRILILSMIPDLPDLPEGIATGLEALSQLGFHLPKENLDSELRKAMSQINFELKNQSPMSLINNPEIRDPQKKLIAELAESLYAPTYIRESALWMVLVSHMVIFFMKNGNTEYSAHTYSSYGMILGHVSHELKLGAEFSVLGIEIGRKFKNLQQVCIASFDYANRVLPWVKHIKYAEILNDEGLKAGFDSGEIPYSGYTLCTKGLNYFFQGKPLYSFRENLQEFITIGYKIKNQPLVDIIQGLSILVSNLSGDSTSPDIFSIPGLTEKMYIMGCEARNDKHSLSIYKAIKSMALYLNEKHEDAFSLSKSIEHFIKLSYNSFIVSEHNFYQSLVLAKLCGIHTEKKTEYLELIELNQRIMGIWAENCPDNFRHKFLLIEAEKAKIRNEYWNAIVLYERSIKSAQEFDFIQVEALGYELFSEFWHLNGNEKIANLYVKEAIICYEKWGAFAISRKLQKNIIEPFNNTSKIANNQHRINKTNTTENRTENNLHLQSTERLDLSTILKASLAISTELNLNRLLERLLAIVVENAGAQKGFIILNENGKYVIEAELNISNGKFRCLESKEIFENEIPTSVINYTARTKKTIVLDNAHEEGMFSIDPYIKTNNIKSILCMPLINQETITGILYLENNTAAGTFTPERLELLSILSSQIAISLYNAGQYSKLEAIVADRTKELADANEKLNLAKEAAESSSRSKSVFLANISHELRTPMNSIIGFAQLMKRDKELGPSDSKYLDIILRSGEHLLSIINDILALAKIESGNIEVESSDFDLSELIEDIIIMLKSRANAKGLALFLDQTSSFPKYVHTDPVKLRQILINLIGNAIKFTDNGSVSVKLSCLSPNHSGKKELLVFEVTDTGIGISKSNIENIFLPFSQIDNAPASEGTGLGLAISSEYARLLGGGLSAESVPGKGSIFRFSIAYDPVSNEIIASHIPTTINITSIQGTENKKILVVEDQEENRILLKKILEPYNFSIREAADGREGIEIAREWMPHLILMDHRMPVMDGLQATKTIRSLPGGKTIKIIAVTAHAFKEEQQEMIDAGCDAFLRKPYKINELLNLIQPYLGLVFITGETEETRTNFKLEDISAASISNLPENLRKNLENAIISLDSNEIDNIISQISEHNKELGLILKENAGKYSYSGILKALKNQ